MNTCTKIKLRSQIGCLLALIVMISTNLEIYSQSSIGRSSKKNLESRADDKTKARQLVVDGLEAMGGAEKLRALKSLTFEGIGHEFAVEQSERPEGPYIVAYQQFTEVRDLIGSRLRRANEIRQFQTPKWFALNTIVSDGVAVYERSGRYIPRGKADVEETELMLALAPEKLFFTALAAPDLRLDRDTVTEGVLQHVIKFTWQKAAVAIVLNSQTKLPTTVETVNASPDSIFWSVWGDYSTKTTYSLWTLESGGIRYPRQRDVSRNGYPLQTYTLTSLKINEAVNSDQFRIPDDARKQSMNASVNADDMPLGSPTQPMVEFATGIVHIPGNWGTTLVRQGDGIVVIEAPISSGYSKKVLAEAKRRFPDLPIKAVITTSDAFPHIGGIREYVADGIPIYALDLNRPLLSRIVSVSRKSYPDNLEIKKRKANFLVVSKKTIVGTGSNRIEIYPVRTETGERMMIVYFPDHKLLYASDLVQKRPNGTFFSPQYLSEVMQAVEREKLSVETVFAMHTERISWLDVTSAVVKQTSVAQTSREQITSLVSQILDADYRADQTNLQRIYRELEPFADDKELGAKVRYWRGFAQWRRGVNGLNDSVDPKELEQDFKLAISEFENAVSKDPTFVDARLAAGASLGLLSYLYGFTPAFAAETSKDPTRVRDIVNKALKYVNEAEKVEPDNPRLLWVLGQIRWTMPAEMGGGQDRAIATNEKGLRIAIERRGVPSDPLTPSWGEPELMMNLAINHLRRKEPDLAAAEKYARSALALVPNWHYIRDILLPQIEAAKAKQP